MYTGLRPKEELIGTQMKLLKPRTRIATPVNFTTSARPESNAAIKSGNMGARAKGPKPCVKVTLVEATMQQAFQNGDQFRGSCGSADGCGTRTPEPLLTKWWEPTSAMISVPGKISVWSSFSSWWSSLLTLVLFSCCVGYRLARSS